MSDCIIFYAPQIFLAAMVVLALIAAAVSAHRRHHNDESEFEKVEEIL